MITQGKMIDYNSNKFKKQHRRMTQKNQLQSNSLEQLKIAKRDTIESQNSNENLNF